MKTYGPVEWSDEVLDRAYRKGCATKERPGHDITIGESPAPEGLSVLPTPVPTPKAHWPEPILADVARAMRRTQQRLALYERGWL